MKEHCEKGYDSDETDWMVYNLVKAYAEGKLVEKDG